MIDAGEPTLGTRLHSVSPSVVEALGHTRTFDYFEFLAEDAPFDLHELDGLCRAAELYGLGAMIKIDQEPRTYLAQRAIGAGFQGVLFADCRGVGDARRCVASARPETPEHGGAYGVNHRRMAYMGYGGSAEYVEALEQIVVALMIEKRGAVADLSQILEVSGVNLVQFGAVDYSLSIGRVGDNVGEDVRAVEREVIARCLAAGVPVRAEIASPAHAAYYRELGVRHFALGVDLVVLFDWWREQGAAVRDIVNAR